MFVFYVLFLKDELIKENVFLFYKNIEMRSILFWGMILKIIIYMKILVVYCILSLWEMLGVLVVLKLFLLVFIVIRRFRRILGWVFCVFCF